VLIGMMGAGKSSGGRCLQERTELALLDLDEIVSVKFGMSISEIFARLGEKKFREAETEALRELSLDQQWIIATGGGIVLREENLNLLKQLGIIVWLDADEATLFDRASRKVDRPLLEKENPRRTFSQLLQARRPLYAKIADVRIETSNLSDEEVADEVLRLVVRNER
jgi:shikimate kinase